MIFSEYQIPPNLDNKIIRKNKTPHILRSFWRDDQRLKEPIYFLGSGKRTCHLFPLKRRKKGVIFYDIKAPPAGQTLVQRTRAVLLGLRSSFPQSMVFSMGDNKGEKEEGKLRTKRMATQGGNLRGVSLIIERSVHTT